MEEDDSQQSQPRGSQRKSQFTYENKDKDEITDSSESGEDEHVFKSDTDEENDEAEEIKISQMSSKLVKVYLLQYGFALLDMKGIKVGQLRDKLREVSKRDSLPVNNLKAPLPKEWTYEDQSEKFTAANSWKDRRSGPKNIPQELLMKVKLGTLLESDVFHLYCTGDIISTLSKTLQKENIEESLQIERQQREKRRKLNIKVNERRHQTLEEINEEDIQKIWNENKQKRKDKKHKKAIRKNNKKRKKTQNYASNINKNKLEIAEDTDEDECLSSSGDDLLSSGKILQLFLIFF
jgi:hypothetical protein